MGKTDQMAAGTTMRFRRRWECGLLAAICLLAGCRASRQIRDPEYAGMVGGMAQATSSPAPAAAAVPPVASPFAGPQPVETCVAYALAQNPDIQAARKKVEAAGERVPQAASLEDPTLSVMGYPFYPAVPQTAGGRATANSPPPKQSPGLANWMLAPRWRKRKPRWRDENWPPRN